ncbi:hypothetical protein Anae109_1871 [Anaeromyxobacter sp. Fw109-5]|nr:hypothetical protein Anae109_1871 [Anaeromyxobacter sp. Fw109-5]
MNTHVNARMRTAIAVLAALGFACLGELPEPPQTGEKQKSTYHSSDANGAIPLRDAAGATIARGSTTPFSPEQTCGGCHDTAVITRGYHFQQGRTGPDNNLLVSDSYNPQKPWLLSPGMYGKT